MKSPIDRGGLRYWLVVIALLAWRSTPESVLAGLPLVLCGVMIHLWAKGCLHQNREVTTTGPYRFVRHPFYSANALVDMGIAVISGWWVLVAALPVWWLAVYIPVIRSEEGYLTEAFGTQYAEYRKKVCALVPFKRPLPKVDEGFSWGNVNISRGVEIPRVLRLVAYPLLFFVWSGLRADRFAFLSDGEYVGLWALAMLGVLHLSALGVERHLKRRRRLLPKFMSSYGFRMAAAICVIVVAAAVPYWETESEVLVFGLGLGLLGASLVIARKRPGAALAAEATVLASIAVMSELLWLTAVPMLYYTALALDMQFEDSGETDASGAGWLRRLHPKTLPSTIYTVMLLAAGPVTIIKEALF